MVITTDAIVTYDQPVDYGIHAFCQVCQVCVNRCPGRALLREKIWWRGVEKNKLNFIRCRPVMARYLGCGVCMKVCPIQKYGMKNVMKHYAATGQVLGKGTHDLEGYELEEKGYYGPGDLPLFVRNFFNIPHGRAEAWACPSTCVRPRSPGRPPPTSMAGPEPDLSHLLSSPHISEGRVACRWMTWSPRLWTWPR